MCNFGIHEFFYVLIQCLRLEVYFPKKQYYVFVCFIQYLFIYILNFRVMDKTGCLKKFNEGIKFVN